MELRQRMRGELNKVRATSASAMSRLGKKLENAVANSPVATQPNSSTSLNSPLPPVAAMSIVTFWLCEGLKKRHVKYARNLCMKEIVEENEKDLAVASTTVASTGVSWHCVNETTGAVVPLTEEIGKYVDEGEVVRVCSEEEMHALLAKIAQADSELFDHDSKPLSPSSNTLGAAISKFRRMGGTSTNNTLRILQRTFEDLNRGPRSDSIASNASNASVDSMDDGGDQQPTSPVIKPEENPIFKSDMIQPLPEDIASKCDVCDVSWPEDTPSKMLEFKSVGIRTHHSCTQFAAEVLSTYPDIRTREQFLGNPNVAEYNRPGVFHICIQSAKELPGAQLLGSLSPYAKFTLLPWKEPFQTRPVESGDTDPVFTSNDNNELQLSHMYNNRNTPIPLLEVELWTSGFFSDDLLASALLDMSPLLRFPNVEVCRWFSLSAHVATSASLMSKPGSTSRHPQVLLTIKFVPLEGKYSTTNEHKFRVHLLKSLGHVIPTSCAACDRVIVNVMKSVWGYRCEHCGIDVHKSCIMKAMTVCECKRKSVNNTNSPTESTSSTVMTESLEDLRERYGQQFKKINYPQPVPGEPVRDTDLSASSKYMGELFVSLHGAHLCSKHCRLEQNFHAKNIFEGDTYCRLSFDDSVFETSPVLKSADPMCMENVCYLVKKRDSVLHLEVIDFNSDQCISEMKVSLFELLQREADTWMETNPWPRGFKRIMTTLRLAPHEDINSRLYSYGVKAAQSKRFLLRSPSKSKKVLGYVLLSLRYDESKRNLLRRKMEEEVALLEREDKECTVDSIRATVERLNRVVRTLKVLEVEYTNIISWKKPWKSAVYLYFFVMLCVRMNAEHFIAYVLLGLIIYMVRQLYKRVFQLYTKRWIDYWEYDTLQIEQLELYRPIAFLYVAVHEARLSSEQEAALGESQKMLKEMGTNKLQYYVRIKYRPNDQRQPTGAKNLVFVPSSYEETLVGTTAPVEKSRTPNWRKASVSQNASSITPTFNKSKRSSSFRNMSVSWHHVTSYCTCQSCRVFGSSRSESNELSGGIDHHAFCFPIPQACKRKGGGRCDLVPWRLFPGLVEFEVCVAVNGELKDSSDMVIASGFMPLQKVMLRRDEQAQNTQEFWIALDGQTSTPSEVHEVSQQSVPPSDDKRDWLLVRTQLYVPETAPSTASSTTSSTPALGRGLSNAISSIGSQKALSESSFVTPPSSPRVSAPYSPALERKNTDADSMAAAAAATALAGIEPIFPIGASPDTSPSHSMPPPSPSSAGRYERAASLASQRRYERELMRAHRRFSEVVLENLNAEKEQKSSSGIGGGILDAYRKVMDTMKFIQNDIGRACGTVACIQNLMNWTHPWKTGVFFGLVAAAAVVCFVIPNRWLVLLFGLLEFSAALMEDKPPSSHFRNVMWNFLSSIPTDEELIEVYGTERELFLKKQRQRAKEKEERRVLRLRFQALWLGMLHSKGDSERSLKHHFVVYRTFRFAFWKTQEDAEECQSPIAQFTFDGMQSLLETTDDVVTKKRTFSFDKKDNRDRLLEVIRKSGQYANSIVDQ